MPTEKKKSAVESLQKVFAKTTIGVVTDYRGIKTPELNDLRARLRDAKVDYKVVKNSLALIAAKEAGMTHLDSIFKDPVAVAFGYGEPTQVAKLLADYIRTTKSALALKAGFLPDRLLSVKELDTLAKLPSREVLLARVVGGMQAPVYGIVNVLAAPLRGLAQVLQARVKQMEAK